MKDINGKMNVADASAGSLLLSLIPIVVLVLMMVLSVSLFGSDALYGSSQVSLLTATAVCVCISMWYNKNTWKELESGIAHTIKDSSASIVILVIIGMMSASWMISGIVPTLIYYGVRIMSPMFFLVASCLICAVVSLMTGSSWTTVATIGVALLGIGTALGIPVGWSAGAIISGAYFGDKISPLSDTTILASAMADVNIFTHIKYMLRTTTPSMTITLVVFLIAGFVIGSDGEIMTDQYTTIIAGKFNVSLWTLVVPVVTGIMIAKKVPSLITLFLSSILAGITALMLQPDILREISGNEFTGWQQLVKGLILTFATDTNIETGNELINGLVSTGGMYGMMPTIWLILCAMCFGGVMMASGMLHTISNAIVKHIKSRANLVSSSVLTGLLGNILTCDQYMSIILTVNAFKDVYDKKGYDRKLLSRSTEDGVTVTSVLIPWNSCGMTQATVLGVPTLIYLPFCVFNYVSPLMSIIYGIAGWGIKRKPTAETDAIAIEHDMK